MKFRKLSALALAAAVLAGPAYAVEYGTIDSAASTLQFRYAQMGVSLDGAFKQFKAELSFDPAQPQAARTVVEVPLKAIDTGSEEGDDDVRGKDWFNTGTVPVVVADAAGKTSFTGSFTRNRVDFGIGEGLWAKDDVVAHEITIAFHLLATPAAQ